MLGEKDAQPPKEIAPSEQRIFGDIQLSKNSLITILICTGLSVLFMRTGILSLFYLAPVGYAVIVTGSIWITFFLAAGVNIIFDFFSRSSLGNSANMLIEIFYFSLMFLLFVWIIGAKNPRTAYRLLAGSAAGVVVFILLLYKTEFFSYLERLIEEINAQAASGEVTLSPILRGLMPAEGFTELFRSLLLRGAAFLSVLFTFFINRHLAYSFVRLIKKQRDDKPLVEFFAPQNSIWVLTGAFASVLFLSFFKIELLEILAWNVFIIYAIIFLAQGTGILMYLLSKRTSSFRMAAIVFLVIVLFSPLNLAVIVMLLLLGIMENWIPIRKGRNQNASYSEAN